MNEKRQSEKIYRDAHSATDKNEYDWGQLFATVTSLENRARMIGAVSVLRVLDSMRKSIARGNKNKKILRATQIKLQQIQAEITEYQQNQMVR